MDSMTSTADQLQAARDLFKRHLYAMAAEVTMVVHEKEPENAAALELLGDIYKKLQDNLGAARWFCQAVDVDPGNPDYLFKAGYALLEAGELDRGMEMAVAFKELTRGHPQAWLLISNIHHRVNRYDEAWEALLKVPDVDATHEGRLMTESRLLIQEKKYGEAIDMIKGGIEWSRKRIDAPFASKDAIVEGHFALAKIYNKLEQYDDAWAESVKAHEMDPKEWDPDRAESEMAAVRDIMSKENLRAFAHASEIDERPVFIVGNPRSGTSLLEQILSMHPDVANGGELVATLRIQRSMQQQLDSFMPYPNCVMDMRVEDANAMAHHYADATSWFSEGKLRVTNKSLGLHGQMGFISLMLPRSRAIMLHRHPLDNCISCYTMNLLHTNHRYVDNLEWLAKSWIIRRKMQDFWMETLDIPVIEFHYDRLVADQEAETKRLVEFLDIPWNDDCLQFHKSKRVAATLSHDQVNKNMYTTSSGRWKNYEKHIGPLIDLLGDYL